MRKSALKTVIIGVLSATFGVLGTTTFYEFFRPLPTADRETTEVVLQAIVAEVNRTSPKSVDEWTRLDSADSVGGPTIIYNYTLMVDLDSSQKENLARDLLALKRKEASENEGLSLFRELEIGLVYLYRDRSGEEIARVVLKHKDF